jgi:hypothetical protein
MAKAKKEENVESAAVEEAPKAKEGVWTPEGNLAEQIEKQKLINEGKLARE